MKSMIHHGYPVTQLRMLKRIILSRRDSILGKNLILSKVDSNLRDKDNKMSTLKRCKSKIILSRTTSSVKCRSFTISSGKVQESINHKTARTYTIITSARK